jgi:hypothetical protein
MAINLEAFGAVLSAYRSVIGYIIKSKLLRVEILAPIYWGGISWLLFFIIAIVFRTSLVQILWGDHGWMVTTFSFMVVPIIATFLAFLCTVLRLQFSLDKIVLIVSDLNGVVQNKQSILGTSKRIIGELLFRALGATIVFAVTLATLMIPGLNIIGVLLGMFYLGADIISSCLSSLAIPLKQQKTRGWPR